MDENSQDKVEVLLKDFLYLVSPLGDNNFFVRVLNSFEKHPTYDIPTLCVGYTSNNRPLFMWNPDFYAAHPPEVRRAFCIHESGHIILNHFQRIIDYRRSLITDAERAWFDVIYNLAADLAVNDSVVRPTCTAKALEYIELLPEKQGLPVGQTFEFYADCLMKDMKDNCTVTRICFGKPNSGKGQQQQGGGSGGQDNQKSEGNGSGQGEQKDEEGKDGEGSGGKSLEEEIKDRIRDMTNHSTWDDILKGLNDDQLDELMSKTKGVMRQVVASAFKETEKARGRGLIPSALLKIIEAMIEPEKIPWETILMDWVASSISHDLEESMCWPDMTLLASPDFLPYPGRTFEDAYVVGIFRDISGSVSDEEFVRGTGVVLGLKERVPSIQLYGIDCDAAIHYEYLIEHEADVTTALEKSKDRHASGGTSFEPPFQRCMQNAGASVTPAIGNDAELLDDPPKKVDLAIYYTDGEAPVPTDLPIDTIWVLTAGAKTRPNMEKVIHLPEK